MADKNITSSLDLERVKKVLATNVEILEVMNAALCQIANCTHSLDAGIPMRAIAVAALLDVEHITKNLEVK